MLATQQPVLRRFWYPVTPLSRLTDRPIPFTLLGDNIVLWKASDGTVGCLKDRCCHRTAKLSCGYLDGDNVVCGYHGWTYATNGMCVRIPQKAEGIRISDRIRVESYRVAQKYGYVWVALEEPLTDIPNLPEAADRSFRQVDQFYEAWNIGALRLMENSFDAAHVAYVHRKTFGNPDKARITEQQEITQNPWGFDMDASIPVKIRGELAQKAVHTNDGETVRRNHASWYMPFMRRKAINYPHGLVHVLITCATPISDDRTMILQWVYRNDTEAQVSTKEVIAFDRAIIEEDRTILESCDPDVPLAVIEGDEKHMASDRPGLVMRRMLAQLLKDHGEVEQRSQPVRPMRPHTEQRLPARPAITQN
jgi:phenylpropionate dioxygenase-like ring-hydroxylating dioxygenase large terminal subunit